MINDQGRRLANLGGDRDDFGDDAEGEGVRGQRDKARALNILFRFLQNDSRILKRFNPTKEILQKMSLGRFIEREQTQRQKFALIDLCLTILKNSTNGLDFHDFTDNERLIWQMRRREFETVLDESKRTEAKLSNLHTEFYSYRSTVQGGLAEFVTLVEDYRKDLTSDIRELKEHNQDILELREAMSKINQELQQAKAEQNVTETQVKRNSKELTEMQ